MKRDEAFKAIAAERDYQDAKFGTAFDDRNTLNDWVCYIVDYAAKAMRAQTREDARRMLVKAAALAVAALESDDRNHGYAPRHYDL